MKDFRKACLSSVVFLICVIIGIIAIYEPFAHSEWYYYQDANLRNSLSGQINYMILGSSNSLRAFDTNVIDSNIMDANSYNLSGTVMPWNGRIALLEEEIKRQPLQTVVIDVYYSSLARADDEQISVEGHVCVLPRLNQLSERLSYFSRTIHINTFDNYISNITYDALYYDFEKILSLISHNNDSNFCHVNYENKGFVTYDEGACHDLRLSPTEAESVLLSEEINCQFNSENMEKLDEIIRYCQNKNAKVILVTSPCSGSQIWKFSNVDDYDQLLKDFAKEHQCEYWDLNLLKNRFSLLSDQYDWWDREHLSASGSKKFTAVFSQLYNDYSSGKDVSNYFYYNQGEMLKDSPYYLYLDLYLK